MSAQQPEQPILRVDGRDYPVVHEDTIKLGEMDLIERHFDRDFESLRSVQRIMATIWVSMRRVDPGITWEQVEEIDVQTFSQVLGLVDEDELDPPSGGGGNESGDATAEPATGNGGAASGSVTLPDSGIPATGRLSV